MSTINIDKQEITPSILRERKRISRNNESSVTNTFLFILVKQLGAAITFRKTKKTKNTIKMLIPELIEFNTSKVTQTTLTEWNNCFIEEYLKEKVMDVSKMNNKQYNRSKEAFINNGLLYFMKKLGYDFEIKQTKRSKFTEKFIKINSVTMKNSKCILETEKLNDIGSKFEEKVSTLFGRDFVVTVTAKMISDLQIDEIPFMELSETEYKTIISLCGHQDPIDLQQNNEMKQEESVQNTQIHESKQRNQFSQHTQMDNYVQAIPNFQSVQLEEYQQSDMNQYSYHSNSLPMYAMNPCPPPNHTCSIPQMCYVTSLPSVHSIPVQTNGYDTNSCQSISVSLINNPNMFADPSSVASAPQFVPQQQSFYPSSSYTMNYQQPQFVDSNMGQALYFDNITQQFKFIN